MSGQGFDTSGLDGAAPPLRRALLEFAVSRSPAVFYAGFHSGDPAKGTSIRFIGPNVEAVTGHAPAAFVEDPDHLSECIHPDDRAAYLDALERIEGSGTLEIEYRLSSAAGDLLWIRDTLRRAERGEDGRQFVGCMIDVTAEKQARASLADAESLKGAITEAAQDSIIAIDEDGLVMEFNTQAEAMFGYRRSEALGRPVGELIVPDKLRPLHQEGLRRLKETGVATILNTRPRLDAMRADGSLFPAEITIVQARVAGRPAYVAEIRDISGQVAAKAEHQKTAVLLRDAVESLPNGFSIYDREDRLVLANSALCKAYGVDPDSIRGSRRADVVGMFLPQVRTFGGIEIGDAEESVELVAGSMRALGDEAIEIGLRNGSWRLLTSQATSDGGQVVISTDITSQKRAEQALREEEEMVRQVLNSTPVPISVSRLRDGRVLYESPALTALFHEDDTNKAIYTGAYDVDPSQRAAYMEQVRSKGGADNFEVHFRRFDGSEFVGALSSRVIEYRGEAAVVTGIVDLSGIKRREVELAHARETLEDAIESLSEGFALFDADDGLVMCNEQFRAFNAPSADALVPGVGWLEFNRIGAERGQYPDAEGRIEEWLEEAVAERGLATNKLFRQSDDRWFEYSHRPTRRNGLVVTRRDITVRVVAERESRRLTRLLREAVESIPNGFGIYDSKDSLILCNEAFAALLGETPDDLVGSSAIDNTRRMLGRLKEFDGQRVGDPEAALPRALARAWEAEREPIEMQLKSGRWLQFTSHPIADGGRVDIRTDITRLKQAEASLRDSEEQFRSIVVGNPSPVRVAAVETWEILYESPAAAALFGHPWPSPRVRSTVESYVDMEAREDVVRILESKGRIDNHEVMMRRTDGTTFWVEMSARVIRYHGKDVCVTSLVDLTETKAREAELRQARETLEDAMESLSEGLALYDADDRLVLCNSQYRSYHEGSEDLLVPGALWPEVTRTRGERGLFVSAAGHMEEWLEGQMAQRGIASSEIFAWSDGRWFEYSHRPTRQGGFVSTWRDVTERKKMEQTLRDSEEMVRQVLEACPVPITMNRADDGVIIYESPAARALLKYDKPQEGRSVLSRWVNTADRENYLERLRLTGAVDGMEMPCRRGDGEDFWCSLSSRMIDYRGEKVIVSSIFDLTERRASEAELARQSELLHQSEKLSALGEVLAGVAHELNNPLSVVVGQALMLEEAAEDEQVARRAEKIRNAANRCARIVKTFLSMARRQATEHKRVDMNEVIEAALEVTGYSLRAAGIEVSLRLAKTLPEVMADDHQLQQVITNLMVNAQHALEEVEGPRRLRIITSFRRRAGQVVVKIKDNGPGIPEENRARIFEPLFTTKAFGAGTGLGLALCHRLIEAHGGTIEIEGGAGEGAVFAIRLPAAEAEIEDVSQVAAPAADPRTYRILVVDDEPDVAEFLADVLEIDGHRVSVAVSGKEMLERLEGETFDVILSDIRMPEIDGPSLYRILGERWPNLVRRLAFVTGDTLSAKVTEFLDSSGRPYIEKPITPKDLRQLIARVLDEGRGGKGR